MQVGVFGVFIPYSSPHLGCRICFAPLNEKLYPVNAVPKSIPIETSDSGNSTGIQFRTMRQNNEPDERNIFHKYNVHFHFVSPAHGKNMFLKQKKELETLSFLY